MLFPTEANQMFPQEVHKWGMKVPALPATGIQQYIEDGGSI